MYRKILVPLERQGASEVHLEHAAALARAVGAELTLLRAITIIPTGEHFMQQIQVEPGSRGEKRLAEAREHLAQLLERLQGQGLSAQEAILISEQAEDEAIVDYCSKAGCDLIVMPKDRRSFLARWLAGNVAAKVQRRSPVPVLFVGEATGG